MQAIRLKGAALTTPYALKHREDALHSLKWAAAAQALSGIFGIVGIWFTKAQVEKYIEEKLKESE
jgi:hypothetical protein